ncbi:DUF3885 domain-containing protein [Streptomyces brasiliensis]|uniref:DUF3885 domain-containing protein n=1 Tax=Streptomyces brasiliensis TaxID=1954 RepID=A0A917KD15_9ACTN|nr:hypothetical protein GCM10010121_018970 [Streptomyces brasiliensis]
MRAVADEALVEVLITDTELRRIRHLYDGGTEIILATPAERDELGDRHASRGPHHPTGLRPAVIVAASLVRMPTGQHLDETRRTAADRVRVPRGRTGSRYARPSRERPEASQELVGSRAHGGQPVYRTRPLTVYRLPAHQHVE